MLARGEGPHTPLPVHHLELNLADAMAARGVMFVQMLDQSTYFRSWPHRYKRQV
jgi:hypothetical protein